MNCICCKKWGDCPMRREDPSVVFDCFGKNGFSCDYEEPDYITPAQYKERTGREYPDSAPVGVFCIKADLGLAVFHVNAFDVMKYGVYKAHRINPSNTERVYDFKRVYCAFGDIVPPDDYVPEEDRE